MWATLQRPPWNVLQCVCAHAPVCVWVIPQLECDCLVPECVPLCVLVSTSCSNNLNLHAKWKHCDKRDLVDTISFFYYHICITLLDAKINVPHINVKEKQWRFGWLTHWSGCDILTLWALSCQRLLLSLHALTHTSHHSADGCPEASPVRTHQTLLWAPEPCSGSSNPIIAELTVIANIGDTLTWSERMKTSTVKEVKWGDEWGWHQVWGKWVTSGIKQEGEIVTQCFVITVIRINCVHKCTLGVYKV